MGLNSFKFLIWFFIIFLIMAILEKIKKYTKKRIFERFQIFILLISSYIFISTFNWKFCICIGITTILTYYLGIYIEKYNSDIKIKKIITCIGIIGLIVTLGYFKYTNFFIESITKIFNVEAKTLNIILPIGISFYIFSALSYIIDIYHNKYQSEKNLIDFALYISFFPKLTAGPIVREDEFIPQIKKYNGITVSNFATGIQIFIFGLFKKIVLADRLGVFVDDIFWAPLAYNTMTVIWGIISYSLQIYFDFSGYSDMAIGISKILGFNFKPNFNLPYIANGISDFWKRWHISLSSWFRDYLYFPLGGNRKGKIRTYINLIMVMLVSGLWHGAGITFIIWGLLHGIMNSIEKIAIDNKINIPKWANIPLTYIFVSLSWVIFRADTIENAVDVFKSAFTIHGGISQYYTWTFFAIICLTISTIMAYLNSKKINTVKPKEKISVNGYYKIMDLSKISSLIIFFTTCGLIMILAYFGDTSFIYGSF